MSRDLPSVGIIGPGAIADMHAHALLDVGATIAAVAGPDAHEREDFSQRHAVRASYATADELLNDETVEAVIIAAPSGVHASLATQSVRAGRPTLCEIPLALTLDDARDAVAAAEGVDTILGVAHTLRYWEPHRLLAAELEASGERPEQVIVQSHMLRQSNVGWTGKQRTWTDSVVWHHGSHAMDAALWFLGGHCTRVVASPGRLWTNGSVMACDFLVESSHGGIANVSLSYHSRRPRADYTVITPSHTWEISGGELRRDDSLIMSEDVAMVQSRAIREQDLTFLRAAAGEHRDDFFTARDALPALDALSAADVAG